MVNLCKASAFSDLTPYEIFQEWEGIPVHRGFIVQDLLHIEMDYWKRKGVRGAFIDLDGSGGVCNTYICEIPAQGMTTPQRHLFEEVILILEGQGATSIWNEGGKKQTLEWQRGSLFSVPLNSWHQHFNGQRKDRTLYIAMTDAPVVLNRYRNLDFVFDNSYTFSDRYCGDPDELSAAGHYVDGFMRGRVWESNFVADVFAFEPKIHEIRGRGNRTTLFELANSTMSPHVSQFPAASYKKAHRHGPGAHVIILTGHGYSFLWEEGKEEEKKRVDWGPMSMFAPPLQWFHQHFNPEPDPARYVALKPYGAKYRIEKVRQGLDFDVGGGGWGGVQIDFENQPKDIHEIFVEECKKKGAQVS